MFGFLNCNKPVGITSRDLVNVVQRRIRPTKVGHCGTLDPLAEGVMVLAIGPASRLTSYIQQQAKRYIGEFRLGASSETGDLEQGFIEHPELPIPTLSELQAACGSLVGMIRQVPPAYSAVKVNGRRAYKRVRAGETVEMPERTVRVDSIEIIALDYPQITLDITCGAGTYIRTLGMDLANAVGSKAVMTKLVRESIGSCALSNALSVDQLQEVALEEFLLPATIAIHNLPRIMVNDQESSRIGHGLCIEMPGDFTNPEEVAAITADGQLQALLRPKGQVLCPKRVFCS